MDEATLFLSFKNYTRNDRYFVRYAMVNMAEQISVSYQACELRHIAAAKPFTETVQFFLAQGQPCCALKLKVIIPKTFDKSLQERTNEVATS